MGDTKKDHSVGTGTGAVAGAITGAAVGSVAGPIGTLIGAGIGAVAGAKAGDEVAEWVNPTEYSSNFKEVYKTRSYYQPTKSWDDYEPAYKYGYDTYGQYRGQRFEDVESNLERDWDKTRANSSLAWNDAREAVRDGWHEIENKLPGDFDRDGR